MPYLDTSEAIRARLQAALAARSHWVFLADRADGTALLMLLTGLALAQGASSSEMDFGGFEIFNVPTARLALVSFLSLPKARVSAEDVNALLALSRAGVRTDGGQDVILLPSGGPGREDLTAAAIGLAAGTCYDQPPEAN